ncbi:MAG: Anaerobic dimethyl sulfoxide reductase chain B [Syntrophorhabdus sp. PtaU1.Bin058]|nr:MAG: Anaerobic dimethyl sulfoxide reductase chain B [Syntrophorhabdus sp. PtaU1.Bin058]
MSQYAFSFDVSRCSGCMACVVACQDQNDFVADETVAFRHVTKYEEGECPSARISYFSLACQQCGDAPCIIVCPAGAISRRQEDGTVLVDRDLCVGCHSCELACPFGAPKFPEDGKMAKCDLCVTRRENGMKPACVRVCPAQALDVGPIEELSKKKAEKASIAILKSLIFVSPKEL